MMQKAGVKFKTKKAVDFYSEKFDKELRALLKKCLILSRYSEGKTIRPEHVKFAYQVTTNRRLV